MLERTAAALAGHENFPYRRIDRQGFQGFHQAADFVPEILGIAELRQVDRHDEAVLAVPAPFWGAFQRLGEQRVGRDEARDAFDHERQARAFGACHRQRNLCGLRIGRRVAVLVEGPASGYRLAGSFRLVQLSHRNDARSHVEHHGLWSRDRDRDRAGGHARCARAVIDDIGPRRRERDRGHALAGGRERVVAERRGVRGCPDQREPDTRVACLAQGLGSSAHHCDRPRRAIGFDQDRSGRLGADHDFRPRIHVAGFYQIDIARDSHDAVRVHASEIRPDEDIGDDRRIGFRQANPREDVRREAL